MALLSGLFGIKERDYDGWIDVETLAAALEETPPPLIIDVRNVDEFYGPLGHIEGAVNVPLPTFQTRFADYVKEERPIVLVCHTDRRSRIAASLIHQAGRKDILVLRGGMTAWRSKQ